jgi:hypothetical protein
MLTILRVHWGVTSMPLETSPKVCLMNDLTEVTVEWP